MVCVASTPAVRLADRLTSAVGWAVLLSWLLIALIALAHRHVVGPLLILAGGAQALALVVLIPDVLAGFGWLSRARTRATRAVRPVHLMFVPGASATRRRFVTHLLRRRS
jgi:hypothetical protein